MIRSSYTNEINGKTGHPKIKLMKSTLLQKPSGNRRLQTEGNVTSGNTYAIGKVFTNQTKTTQKTEAQFHLDKPKQKYLEVYSKLHHPVTTTHVRQTSDLRRSSGQKESKRAFKVHANKPFLLNKPSSSSNNNYKVVKTEADQGTSILNYTRQQKFRHQRKISHLGSTGVESLSKKYEIDSVAGKGTFGTVYCGHVRGTGKKIAIKKVLQDKRYKNRELQILKQLKHPNLLQMKDYFMTEQQDKEYLNVVMDYFPQNLYQSIRRKNVTPLTLKLYIYQILKGLMYLSFLAISHRDMKPHNVLVNPQTHKVVICDFGSAKQLVKGEPNLAYICSRCYRAPELIFGATDYTSQIDIWSTGCILVEMINGDPPFLGDSQIDQLIEIIKIMGNPSKAQINEMNPDYDLKEYSKFPSVKKTPWKHVLKTKDPLLIDLVDKIMQYSPIKRLTPEQALKHQYFDELREESFYLELQQKLKKIPPPDQLFSFNTIQKQHLSQESIKKLIPQWYRIYEKTMEKEQGNVLDTNHTSHTSYVKLQPREGKNYLNKGHIKKLHNLTSQRINLSSIRSSNYH